MNKIKNRFFMALTLLLTLGSCSSIKTLPNGKQIDKKLVGIWKGSETDKQVKGLKKEWRMTRNDNGTFTLNFKTIYEGEVDESIENGNWWIKEKTFYEYHKDSDKTDIYKYIILNKNQVRFEMLSTGIEFENKNYSFIDTKVSKIKSKQTLKDGLSIENAIKVKSVAKEYEYIRKTCQNCQFLGQFLIEHKGKKYDKLKFKKENGQEALYYFDISSFYGKW